MPLPRKLTICGTEWAVVFDAKQDGGAFTWETTTIKIGKFTHERTEQILLHEVSEIILVELEVRYVMTNGEGNGAYLFNFDHRQFDVFALELNAVMKQLWRFYAEGSRKGTKKSGT